MAETILPPSSNKPASSSRQPGAGNTLERFYKLAVIALAAFVVLSVALFLSRAAVYKIHAYERGLHLRGGRFVSVDDPGWHVQIPLVDTVIIVKVNERLGYIERLDAMTSDDVTMIVSLQYTYRVTNPERFALEVDDPERIVFEFVQGKLRDVVNTKPMTEVMHSRAAMNQEVIDALQKKEEQYGVQFITVQLQSASPPDEVMTAIKDRMVAVQRQEQAQAESAQKKTLADAEFYAAQRRADATAYQITTTAEAEAQQITLTTEAKRETVRAILSELENKGDLAEMYMQYLIAQELKGNSKWIISGETGAMPVPIVDLRSESELAPIRPSSPPAGE
jgi:membrane protease subunit HflK